MSLFVCDHCQAIENTALGLFWCRKPRGLPRLCSECGKGEWHGEFPKRTYDPVRDADLVLPMDGAA